MKERARLVILLCIVWISVGRVYGQKASTRDWDRGNAYYRIAEYSNALKSYQRLIYNKNYRPQALYKVADCYRMLNDNKSAENYYKQTLENNKTKDTLLLYNYAQVLRKNGKYMEARNRFQELSGISPGNGMYQQYVNACDSAISWSNASGKYKVTNLKNINSEYSDITPTRYKNGIVFASNREDVIIKKKSGSSGDPYYNLLFSRCDSNGNCRGTRNFSVMINSLSHECSPFFTKDYDTIYFTRGEDRPNYTDTISRLKLYSSENIKGQWKIPYKFIFNDSTFSYAHPSLDKDERLFFFVSDMKGGYGGTDIYVCVKIDNKWTNPINLGPTINTSGNELYPFYHPDGTLYFSSDTHTGIGGYDVFEARQENGEWISIHNLQQPINSSGDDFSIYFNEEKKLGFFSSNREGGIGKEDIYKIELR
jgi:hypothetical protein